MIIVPYHNKLSVSIEFRNRCILESSPPFFRLCSSQLLSVAFDIHQMVRSIEHLDGFRRKKQAAAHTLKLANSVCRCSLCRQVYRYQCYLDFTCSWNMDIKNCSSRSKDWSQVEYIVGYDGWAVLSYVPLGMVHSTLAHSP